MFARAQGFFSELPPGTKPDIIARSIDVTSGTQLMNGTMGVEDEQISDVGVNLEAWEPSAEYLETALERHAKWLETDGKEGEPADLSNAVLVGAQLSNSNLSRATLNKADLSSADLSNADLRSAHMRRATLTNAILRNAVLTETKFTRSKLNDADLVGAQLDECSLFRADLSYSNLLEATLVNANLSQANLKGSDLVLSDLSQARLISADLSNADLTHANLENADLSHSNIVGALLANSNLQRANLQDAMFDNQNIQNSKMEEMDGEPRTKIKITSLLDADLTDSDLTNASLSTVTGLRSDKLAGADLTNAKLPEKIGTFEELSHVQETSKNARSVFIGLLAASAYSWLTIWTTTDAQLLPSSSTTALPIIQSKVPIAGFFHVAPIILLAMYIYFHLYLDRLWAGLSSLPAVLQDGRPLHQKVYPWLLNGVVRSHLPRLKDRRTLLSRVEYIITVVLAWWVVPLTLMAFWVRYLPRHEWGGTIIQLVLLVASIGTAIMLHRHTVRTLKRMPTKYRWKTPWTDWRTLQFALTLFTGLIFFGLSWGAVEGVRAKETKPTDLTTWVPKVFALFDFQVFANLRAQKLSTIEIDGKITGPRLRRINLQYADAQNVWLENSDLDRAMLRGANLSRSNLQGANLRYADLREANLSFANLKEANLRRALLQETDLSAAVLQGANLADAQIQGASLLGADLRQTIISWAQAQKARLNGAQLQGAKLTGIQLQGANLHNANLQGAELDEADLTGALAVTQAQLDQACGDKYTLLPAGLTIKPCPPRNPTTLPGQRHRNKFQSP